MLKKLVSNLKNGFTIIEITVVVAIILVLVSIVIVAGSSAKAGARDNQRKTDIRLLQVKLETYREQNGLYPTSLADSTLNSGSVIPKDPSTNVDYQYVPLKFVGGACGVSYHLGADLENSFSAPSQVSIIPDLVKCVSTDPDFVFTVNKTYDVTSPN